jgi:hypothetical protein
MKEAREFAGAHVLSMVRAHYPLIDFTLFAKGYPKEVGMQEEEHQRPSWHASYLNWQRR